MFEKKHRFVMSVLTTDNRSTEVVKELIKSGEEADLPPLPERDMIIDIAGHAIAEAVRTAINVIERAPMTESAKSVAEILAIKSIGAMFEQLEKALQANAVKSIDKVGQSLGELLKDALGPDTDVEMFSVSSPEELDALLKKLASRG